MHKEVGAREQKLMTSNDSYIDKAHMALDIFHFAVFFKQVKILPEIDWLCYKFASI